MEWARPKIRNQDVFDEIALVVGQGREISLKCDGQKIYLISIPDATALEFDKVMTAIQTKWPEAFL